MLLIYGVLALFSESARTERNIMALMMLVLAVFTVVPTETYLHRESISVE